MKITMTHELRNAHLLLHVLSKKDRLGDMIMVYVNHNGNHVVDGNTKIKIIKAVYLPSIAACKPPGAGRRHFMNAQMVQNLLIFKKRESEQKKKLGWRPELPPLACKTEV